MDERPREQRRSRGSEGGGEGGRGRGVSLRNERGNVSEMDSSQARGHRAEALGPGSPPGPARPGEPRTRRTDKTRARRWRNRADCPHRGRSPRTRASPAPERRRRRCAPLAARDPLGAEPTSRREAGAAMRLLPGATQMEGDRGVGWAWQTRGRKCTATGNASAQGWTRAVQERGREQGRSDPGARAAGGAWWEALPLPAESGSPEARTGGA